MFGHHWHPAARLQILYVKADVDYAQALNDPLPNNQTVHLLSEVQDDLVQFQQAGKTDWFSAHWPSVEHRR